MQISFVACKFSSLAGVSRVSLSISQQSSLSLKGHGVVKGTACGTNVLSASYTPSVSFSGPVFFRSLPKSRGYVELLRVDLRVQLQQSLAPQRTT